MNKIAIVLGAFHKKEMEQMLVFVKDEIKKHSLTIIKEVWVPGSMEKPLAVKEIFLILIECYLYYCILVLKLFLKEASLGPKITITEKNNFWLLRYTSFE